MFEADELMRIIESTEKRVPENNIAYCATRTASTGLMNCQMNFADDSKRLQRIANGHGENEDVDLIVERMHRTMHALIVCAVEGVAYAEKFREEYHDRTL
ncbi:MAG: hypothetical protein VB016_04315 [Methanomassiliicoccaceae archaeon]|nr:hypothetical protein [Methanomassiliicoccaceae archaeon]